MDALRTPDDRFVGLPDFAYEPHYAPVGDGLRMAWVEAGPAVDFFRRHQRRTAASTVHVAVH